MAAVIEFRTATRTTPSAPPLAVGPQLRLVHGGRSPVVRRRRQVFLVRRAAVAAAVLVLALVVASVARGLATSGAAVPAAGAPAAEYVVHAGDTMWSIAEHVAPAGDRRRVVEELVAANGGRTALDVGQVVRVPASLRGI